ncbi:iron uptake system protein EfeO [Marmoricola sp. URHB0036]|uniref:iron uptake system protein EfeO n=1 Tax=Marmoricola sp. URHB0036 TaxID=1298863 RepID=UPI0003FFC7FB|nr:iron uptake system protein EfeO [Marmoricola sp. URHB0036]
MNRLLTAACAAALLVPLSACSLTQSNKPAAQGGQGTINVDSSSDKCDLTTSKAPSGNVVFKVKNTGNEVTEFYLYGEDGMRIVGEIENIGPGLSRDLVVRTPPGKYVTACKPGMKGQGIRNAFEVTDSGKDTDIKGVDQAAINQATSQYAAYVKDQSQELVDQTTEFATLYKNGEDDKARALFPLARGHWERIETVAESFGDLDPRMDLREADLEKGQKWTGWHRIEKDLWPPASGYRAMTPAQRATFVDDLLANTKVLDKRVQTLDYTVDQIGNGSKGLLDEVASGKITGEEDIWSHTDLWDFQANVDGARVGYEGLKPLLDVKDPALSKQIQTAFDALQVQLDKYKTGDDSFVFYDKVTEAQRKDLSDAVNALAEPLSKMTGAITL